MIWVRGLVLMGVGVLLACQSSVPPMEDDHTPAKLAAFTPEKSVETLWKLRVGSSGKRYVKLAPVVQGNRVFTVNISGLVTARDIHTERKLWERKLKASITVSPVIGGDRIFLVTDGPQVVTLDVATGKVLWQVPVANEVLASPALAGSRLVVKTTDGEVVAISVYQGHELWRYQHGGTVLGLRGDSSPRIQGQLVLVGFADGKLAALDLESGHLVWERIIAIPSGRLPIDRIVAIAGECAVTLDAVYVVTYQGQLVALRLENGELLWEHPLSSYVGLVVDGKHVYVVDDRSQLWAFDRLSGQVLWKQNHLADRHLTLPSVVDDGLVVGDGEGFVHWLSKRDGHFLARTRVSHQAIVAVPLWVDDRLYINSLDGHLQVFRVGNMDKKG